MLDQPMKSRTWILRCNFRIPFKLSREFYLDEYFFRISYFLFDLQIWNASLFLDALPACVARCDASESLLKERSYRPSGAKKGKGEGQITSDIKRDKDSNLVTLF